MPCGEAGWLTLDVVGDFVDELVAAPFRGDDPRYPPMPARSKGKDIERADYRVVMS